MNSKAISENPYLIVGFFSVCFIVGIFASRDGMLGALPMIFFHAILLVNTFFSIRRFGPLTPEHAHGQKATDLVLVLIYAVLPFVFWSASLYLVLATMLFIVALFKYAFLLGIVPKLELLRRKIIIDICGVLWNVFAMTCFALATFAIQRPAQGVLWIWTIVFAAMNVYWLGIKPMYRL